MVFIYVLKLEQGKFYVGKTHNPHFRLDSHFAGQGCQWTQKFKPLQVVELRPNCDDYDEDKITRQYMDKHGVENVRGGSFVTMKLDKSVTNTLQQMKRGTGGLCFNCGNPGHFARDCNRNSAKRDIWVCECGKEFGNEREARRHADNCSEEDDDFWVCECGREFDTELEAKRHADNCSEEGDDSDENDESSCWTSYSSD